VAHRPSGASTLEASKDRSAGGAPTCAPSCERSNLWQPPTKTGGVAPFDGATVPQARGRTVRARRCTASAPSSSW